MAKILEWKRKVSGIVRPTTWSTLGMYVPLLWAPCSIKFLLPSTFFVQPKQCRYGNKAKGVHIYIAYLAIVEVRCDTEVGVRSRQHVEYQVVSPSIPAGEREREVGTSTPCQHHFEHVRSKAWGIISCGCTQEVRVLSLTGSICAVFPNKVTELDGGRDENMTTSKNSNNWIKGN